VTRFVLDTTFVIDVLRGVPAARVRYRRFFEEGDDPVVTDVVVCEASTGTSTHPDPDLSRILDEIEFVQSHFDVALRAGQIRAESRRVGRALSLPDALIAAVAEADGAVVLTRNEKDFALTPARLETY
jgi:predicted nucleic acid-binding protein